MSLKNLARAAYRRFPDGAVRRGAAAVAYRLLYGNRLRSCTYRSGVFQIETSDGVVVRSARDFDPEPLLVDFNDLPLGPGAVVADLGGNIGAVALYLAARVGTAGRVISFEPDERNLDVFRDNMRLNGNPAQLTLVPKGVSDHVGVVEFFAGGNYTSSVHRTNFVEKETERYAKVTVPVTTLDEEVRRLGLGRLDLIKMDIEGSEVEALRGALETLRRHHPVLIIETHIINGRSTVEEVRRLLDENGYRDIRTGVAGETPVICARA